MVFRRSEQESERLPQSRRNKCPYIESHGVYKMRNQSKTDSELHEGQRKTLPVAGVSSTSDRYKGLGFQGNVEIGVPKSKGRQCELSGLRACKVLPDRWQPQEMCINPRLLKLSKFALASSKDTKRELFDSKSWTARGDTMATLSEVCIKGVYV